MGDLPIRPHPNVNHAAPPPLSAGLPTPDFSFSSTGRRAACRIARPPPSVHDLSVRPFVVGLLSTARPSSVSHHQTSRQLAVVWATNLATMRSAVLSVSGLATASLKRYSPMASGFTDKGGWSGSNEDSATMGVVDP